MNENLFARLNSSANKIIFFVIPALFYFSKVSLDINSFERWSGIIFIIIHVISTAKFDVKKSFEYLNSYIYFGSLMSILIGFLFFFVYKEFVFFDLSYMKVLYFISSVCVKYNNSQNTQKSLNYIHSTMTLVLIALGSSMIYIFGFNIIFYIISSQFKTKR